MDIAEELYALSPSHMVKLNWNKTKLPTVEASFQPTVDSSVLFQFQGCADAWNKADHRQHVNCSFISDVRTSHETLKQFRRVEKYANEAETVSVFYFSFISPRATGLKRPWILKVIWWWYFYWRSIPRPFIRPSFCRLSVAYLSFTRNRNAAENSKSVKTVVMSN